MRIRSEQLVLEVGGSEVDRRGTDYARGGKHITPEHYERFMFRNREHINGANTLKQYWAVYVVVPSSIGAKGGF